jgi:hypothetical protein
LAGRRAHKRCREAAERMPDDNKVAAVTDRPDDGVGVLRPTCRLVLAREVDRDRIVPALTQRGRDEVPVPGASAAAMDEPKRRHAQRSPMRNRMTGIDALTL